MFFAILILWYLVVVFLVFGFPGNFRLAIGKRVCYNGRVDTFDQKTHRLYGFFERRRV